MYAHGEREVTLLLGPGINPRLWLNGRPAHDGGPVLIPAAGDRVAVKLSLHDGWNTLVARRVTKSGSGFLSTRLEPAPREP